MYKELTYKVTGIAPMIQHNGRMANPRDPMAKTMKLLTLARKKTDDHHQAISDLEFVAGLYTTQPLEVELNGLTVSVSGGGRVCVPATWIEGMLIDAGKKAKLGKQFKSDVMVAQNSELEYANRPKDIGVLLAEDRFRLVVRARVGQAAVMRTRPIFGEWSFVTKVSLMDGGALNERDVDEAFRVGGMSIGLSDWRPKYGRFVAERVA